MSNAKDVVDALLGNVDAVYYLQCKNSILCRGRAQWRMGAATSFKEEPSGGN